MDTKGLALSDSITVQLVRESPSKRLVILSAGAMVSDKEGKQRFQCLVEIDGGQKTYRPNKTTIKALQDKFGFESNAWVGKSLNVSVGTVQGKEAILGVPV